MRRLIGAAVACSVFAGAAAPQAAHAQPAGAAAVAADPGPGTRIDGAILRDRLGMFWGAVLVAKDGEVVLAKGYGIAGPELRAIDADSLFDIGSVSKQFTAAAVLKLQEEGKLKVTDAVAAHLTGPEGKELPAKAAEVSLLDLMNHTSGMSDEGAIQRLDFADRDEAVRRAFASEFESSPGEMFEYCNAGYIVLAAVVEKVSGKKFEDYVREEIFRPAGMAGTGFIDGEGLDLSRATVRMTGASRGNAQKRTILQDGWGWGLRGAGGVVTSLNDMLAWDRALRGEAVLSSASKEQMFWADPVGYGCGWFVELTPRGTRRAHHSGGTRGYAATVSRFLDEGWFVCVLTREGESPHAVEALVLKELFPPEKSEVRIFLAGLELNQYKNATVDEGLKFVVTGGERIRLMLVEEAGSRRAEVVLSKGRALKLAAELKQQAGGAGAGEGGITATLSALPYTLGGDGSVMLPETSELMVQAEYRSMGEDGKPLVDARPTLMAVDVEGRFLPLIVRMDPGVAAAVAGDLERVAR